MTLEQLVTEKKASVAIVGLGYVGLPLALRFSEAGFQVSGFDTQLTRIDQIRSGSSPLKHIPSNQVQEATNRGFTVHNDFALIGSCDCIIICVPTPLNKHREPDLSYIRSALLNIKPYLRENHLISLESTTYPGTTREEVVPIAESAGLTVGQNCFIIYSPEREDPGNARYRTQTIPKIVSGITEKCISLGITLYSGIIDKVVPVTSPEAAEMTKLLENIHRAVNIGLVNEMKIVADRMGVDIYEVIDAAATKPFGFTAYYPGPGLGGHCIPIDPFYLTWKAREFGVHTRFIELAGEVNHAMPHFVVSKLMSALNMHQKTVNGSKILIIGIAYKKNIEDIRESPAIAILEELVSLGGIVSYHDSFVPEANLGSAGNSRQRSVSLTKESLPAYDAVIVATDHDDVDYALIRSTAKLIIDTRGRYRKPASHIFRA